MVRRAKRSSSWNKQRVKVVANIHAYMENAEKDNLNKISTQIIKNHDAIGIEDLQVSNM
ncbi:hypothetical protein FA950_29510 [Bacillus thuringiensis]|nr:hypothetical protein FA950_29510 [Bacillus thuringiensis]